MQARKKVQIPTSDELFGYATKVLTMRAQSAEELRVKLRRKTPHVAEVDGVIARLKEIGYLNDVRFAESFATARRDNDGFGKFRVLTDLRKRRVTPKLAEKAVTEAFAGVDETTAITNYVERRLPLIAAGGVNDQLKLAAAYRKLRRAGFATSPVMAVLKRFAAKPEELEDPPDESEEEA